MVYKFTYMEKVHEINIYGDIVPFKYWNDGSEYDRSDLNTAIDNLDLKEGDELVYNIHTFGGCTTTAFSMYNKLLRVKKEKKITLTSRADGFCASSGVIILLAGDKRIGSKYLKPFVHNAWLWTEGNKDDIKKSYENLEKVDNDIAELYEERTSISKEDALSLMNESRDVTLDECLNYGFYTEIENIYSSENSIIFNSLKSINTKNRVLINKYKPKKSKMAKNELTEEKVQGMLDATWTKIKNALKIKDSPKNKIVQDANGIEIDFNEITDDSQQEVVGDKAIIDGSSAQGDYVMPSGETYVFDGGVLTEIKEAEGGEGDEDVEALKQENADLKTQIEEMKGEAVNLKDKIKDQKDKKKAYKNSLEEVQEDVKAIKKGLGSSFKYDPKKKNYKKSGGETRQVLKSTE